MKPHHLVVPLVLAALAALGGAASARADNPDGICRPTNLIFYTTDTQNLAKALGTNRSACANYYVSISPTTAPPNPGEPRGGPALAAVHAQAPHFHALAELRPKQWTAYAAANGWYATGVKLHDDMLAAGYSSALGDTWAVNEVGSPSDSPVNTDVFNGVGDARQGFRDFVRGLYTGSSGPPLPGLVFAADPLQVSPDLSQYAQGLQNWFADAPFWDDMHAYVRFWAQESYADARTWGEAGASLEERAAYLNDYYLHGSRLAAEANDATAAARAFLADAYTPLGNASYKYGAPDMVTGIGFGYTDIGVPGMSAFISAQTYALRSSTADHFGFAVVPKNAGTDTAPVESRLAAAIHDSETDPLGACTAAGESCAFDVDGAAHVDTWKALANTLEGTNRAVAVGSGVSVTYDTVAARGATWFTSSPSADPPAGFDPLGRVYHLETTALYTGGITVCLPYDSDPADVATPHLFEAAAAGWVDITTSAGCGGATTLGTFALFIDRTPPVLTVPSPLVIDATGPDGALATYVVSATDGTGAAPTIACDHASGELYAIGDTTVTCTATDGSGNAATGSFTVHVEGADEQLADLAAVVDGVGPGKSLSATVAIAQWLFAHGLTRSACLTLTTFDLEVRAQSGKKIPATQATALIADGDRIKTVLGCAT